MFYVPVLGTEPAVYQALEPLVGRNIDSISQSDDDEGSEARQRRRPGRLFTSHSSIKSIPPLFLLGGRLTLQAPRAKQEENRGPEARTQVVPVWGWTQGTAQLISLAPGESRTGPADTPDSAVGSGKTPLLWGQTLQAPCPSVSGSIPWRSRWHPTPVFLPGKSHGWRSLAGYSPWSPKESDVTEQLSMHAGKH